MEFAALVELIPTLGFPIVLVLILFMFIYKIYNDMEKSKTEAATLNQQNMEAVQARCAERETWLQGVLKEAHETNAKFAEVIAKYEAKLDKIQEDVEEIKQEIVKHN